MKVNKIIKCPYCHNDMEIGLCYLDNTLLQFFMFGLSDMNLYFQCKDKSKEEREEIISKSGGIYALKCKNCNTVILNNNINQDSDLCLKCGYYIFKEWTVCPKCNNKLKK